VDAEQMVSGQSDVQPTATAPPEPSQFQVAADSFAAAAERARQIALDHAAANAAVVNQTVT
jgi:hypothetical protein